MKVPMKSYTKLIGIALAVAIPFVIGACGSGSHGNFSIEGILAAAGIPVTDATVSVGGTTDTGFTDDDGHFALDTDLEGTSLNLIVMSKSGINSIVTLADIPADAVGVVLTLAAEGADVTATSVQFVTGGGQRPTAVPVEPTVEPGEPTPTAVPGVPTATPVPGQPTAVPTVKPTGGGGGNPTAKPTTKPTAKPTSGGGGGNGKALFDANCKKCHTAASLKGRTVSQIKGAGMSQGLSDSQLGAIASYLK